MNQVQEKLEAAISAVRDERANHATGSGIVGTPEQLAHVEQELSKMLDDVRNDQGIRQRAGLGRMVVDSWPLQHKLTDCVCKAVDAYSALAGRSSAR